ncbi:DNA topoisomerase 1 [Halotydeus destructor]|nr:DNA topoisomerase 1 [Halotydeus destructor]
MYGNGNGEVKDEYQSNGNYGGQSADDDSDSSKSNSSGSESEAEDGGSSQLSNGNERNQSDFDDTSRVKLERNSDDENSQRRSPSDSEEDVPLSQKVKKETKNDSRRSTAKHNYNEDDSDEDVPLSQKVKHETPSKKKRAKDSDDEEDFKPKAKKAKNGTSKSKKKKRSSSSDDDDYGSDSEDKKKKKKPKKESKKVKEEKSSKKAKGKKEKSGSQSSPEKSPRKKVKEEDEEHVWKWWEDNDDANPDIKWRTLEHKGPIFAPAYEPLPDHVRLKYNGKPIKLSQAAEEVATFYGKMIDHDYASQEIFNTNFFKDWKKFMNSEEKELIKDLKKCDFNAINDYFKEQSQKRKEMSKEEKNKIKVENQRLADEYGYCIVDSHKQKIGNFRIEPPGLFRGRGIHPKMGKVKRRVEAEDVILNIGKKAQIPAAPPGHRWKEVRHDNTVTWLVSWNENIMGGVKYIMLNPSSKLKSMKDWKKYEKARELDKVIDQIREDYMEDWKAREMVRRQRAVALYFIDRLALRAGNEKDGEESADTVGCCSLRVEHVSLHDRKDGKENVVDFDFLGKDSIRYQNSVPVEKRVYKNLKLFMENKKKGDDLFDRLNTSTLNKHLNSLMEGLSAKVFRTYNASITLQRQLDELMKSCDETSIPEKLLAYNRANRAVAILCNHQRTVPKAFDKQMENLRIKINEKKDLIIAAEQEKKKAKKDGSKDEDKYKKRIATLKDQLKKLEVQEVDKEENKQIALGTSKLNYLDPRISVAWCKKYDVPIDKIYNKTQRDKFRWAIEMVDETYRF